MKAEIPLYTKTRFGQPMPFAFLNLRKKGLYRRNPPLLSLVDTGSPWTSIMPSGIETMQLNKNKLKQPKEFTVVSVGGYKFNRLIIEDIDIVVRGVGVAALNNMPNISFLLPTKKVEGALLKDLPAIIGVDFIIGQGFNLRSDSKRGKWCFEVEKEEVKLI